MRGVISGLLTVTAASLTLAGCAMDPSQPGQGPMSFFVTSKPIGKGGDLGGLAGADRHCQSLAAAAGAGNRTWHADLSTQGTAKTGAELRDPNVMHARDRIGTGPWYNAKGALIARNVAELHSDRNNISKETALDERGRDRLAGLRFGFERSRLARRFPPSSRAGDRQESRTPTMGLGMPSGGS